MTQHVLVVDDEQNIQRSLELILGGIGFDVASAASGEAALILVEKGAPDVAFLDINLPGMDGIEVLRRLRESDPDLPVIMISGHATIERAVEATRLGAFDFVEKPFSRDRIVLLARNATESARLRKENAELRAAEEDEMLGESAVMSELRQTIARVAPTEARVLILGESGTGKELIAKALHRNGARASKPFVRVNCAAIPEDLIEAELFGATKGAYTGAVADRSGRFAAAHGGTLLLDEIGDMSLKAQVKVLRVLQEGEFEAVGSTQTQKVDVRVVAATHQDLDALVQERRFRQDLLFRLNVIPIQVPPLRERPGDVALLADHFLHKYAERHELRVPQLHPAASKLLRSYAWPGNIRELKNVVERMVILHHGTEIRPEHLPAELRDATTGARPAGVEGTRNPYEHLPLREARDALERDLIRMALERHQGNVTRAAADLGLERTHLHKRINALGIRHE
ncbi:MAG: sigma-54-dependent transcriptional regulator [Candidatus Krumholzibacteriia bacterium]